MQRICGMAVLFSLLGSVSYGQDSALEKRLNELGGRIEAILEGQEVQRKQLAELQRELDRLRDKINKPEVPAASPEDLKRVAAAVEEVDRKRVEDFEKVRVELRNLGKTIAAAAPAAQRPAAAHRERDTPKDVIPDKVFEYVVQPNDTLSLIIQAYREQNIKVTLDQILKANPGLKPERLVVGKKIFIPAPKS